MESIDNESFPVSCRHSLETSNLLSKTPCLLATNHAICSTIMISADFWDLIESASKDADNADDTVARLRELLCEMSGEEIQAFDEWFWHRMDEAYTWPLWGAAYLINGGCSDDGFEYFRGWLITQGQAVFSAAVAKPESLAAVVEEPDVECEDILSVARDAFEEVTGKKLPRRPGPRPEEPKGTPWEEEELYEMLPKLAKVFG